MGQIPKLFFGAVNKFSVKKLYPPFFPAFCKSDFFSVKFEFSIENDRKITFSTPFSNYYSIFSPKFPFSFDILIYLIYSFAPAF